jgi:hypothetical protein
VDFADHRIACDLAELRRNLTGAQSVGPKLFELLDPVIVPDHFYILSCAESPQSAVLQALDATSTLAKAGRRTHTRSDATQ